MSGDNPILPPANPSLMGSVQKGAKDSPPPTEGSQFLADHQQAYWAGRRDALDAVEEAVRAMHDYRPESDGSLSARDTACAFHDCPDTDEVHVSFRSVLGVIAQRRAVGESHGEKAAPEVHIHLPADFTAGEAKEVIREARRSLPDETAEDLAELFDRGAPSRSLVRGELEDDAERRAELQR